MAVYDDGAQPFSIRAGQFAHIAGAVASVALMAGISIWGYQLVMRDVSGIPVVRAMEGAMRVAPENPGGEVASHTGLTVNEVAAVGEAADPGDTLLLAPTSDDLVAEDLEVQPRAEAGEVLPANPAASEDQVQTALTDPEDISNTTAADIAAMSSEEIVDFANQIAATTPPLGELEPASETASSEVISTDIPGVTTSLRPVVRPRVAVAAVTATTAAVTQALADADDTEATATLTAAQTDVVTTAALPVGTHLVQLGAFNTTEEAVTAWTQLNGRFADYLAEKERVIQVASSNGKTFYRLRAMGFSDLSAARRFCAALEASNADCIPVIVR